jgi:hypothetical protein
MLSKNDTRWPTRLGSLALISLLAGCVGDVSGLVSVRNPDGSIGDPIEGASVTFEPEGVSAIYREITNSAGRYSLTLNNGRYVAGVTHPDYVDLGDDPTYLVVQSGNNTANFFMEPR